MDHEGASQALEQLARQVDRRAVAAAGHVELAGMRLRVAHEVGHRGDAGGLRLCRVEHQHIGHAGDQRDRHEVLDRVVGQLRVQRLVDAVRADRAHQQGVAVRCRLGHFGGAEVAAGAGLVVDDEGLAEGALQLRRQRAGQQVGGAAGRERHDDAHRLARPGGLRPRRSGQRQSGDKQGAAANGHGGVLEASTMKHRVCPRGKIPAMRSAPVFASA